MILVFVILLMVPAWGASLLDETRGVVGRGIEHQPIPIDIAPLMAEEDWAAAAVAWSIHGDRILDQESLLSARLWQVVCAAKAGDTAQAQYAVLTAMKENPAEPRVLLVAAWLLQEDGESAEAVRLLRNYSSDSPDFVGSLILQMRSWAVSGQKRRARRHWSRWSAQGGSDPWFWFEIAMQAAWWERPEAAAAFAQARALPSSHPIHHQVSILYHMDMKQHEEAIDIGISALERFPDDVELRMTVTSICQNSGALRALSALVDSRPESSVAKLILGFSLLQREDFVAAADLFQGAIDQGLNDVELYGLLFRSLHEANQKKEALLVLDAGVQSHPDSEVLWQDFFALAMEIEEGGYALSRAEAAWGEDNHAPWLVVFAYDMASIIEDIELSLTWADRGLELEDLRPESFAMRALSLSRLGRGIEALAAYEEALLLDPDRPVFLNNLAWFLLHPEEGVEPDPERALTLAEHAVAQSHDPVPAYLDTLAAAAWRLGDAERAVEVQREAARLDPTDDHIRDTLQQYETSAP